MTLTLEYNIRTLLACALLIAATSVVAFWPGSGGDFMVDDFHNLQSLGKQGGIDDLDSLREFVFGGNAGPSGRPLSLLSFILDAQNWPADPKPFKITNILIHILNGILLFAVILKLFQSIGRTNRSALVIAGLGALIWTLHPLHTSTVLYVIQRMVELTTLFMLLGIWCYLHGRQKLMTTPGPGYLWMSAGVVLCGVLAVLSKENGAVLPILILVLEFTLLRQAPRPAHWRYWAVPMLALPAVSVLLYLGYVSIDHAARFVQRDFSLTERLLSEGRVLFDYLGKIVLPLNTPTLNHDGHTISTSLLSPPSTLFSLIGIAGLLGFAIGWRKRFTVLSFAVLWFFGAHILESTVLPLEIYFEHRNYLAMAGPIIALAYYLEKHLPRHRTAWAGGIIVFLAIEIAITWQHSYTWGNFDRLTATWVEEQPHSVRANGLNIIQLYKGGATREAYEQAQKISAEHPDHLGIKMLYTLVACLEGQLSRNDVSTLVEDAKRLKIDSLATNIPSHIAKSIKSGGCRQMSDDELIAVIHGLLNNRYPVEIGKPRRSNLYVVLSDIYLSRRDGLKALRALDQTFALYPTVELALKQAYILAVANQISSARVQINKATALDMLRNPLLPSKQEEIDKTRGFVNKRATELRAGQR